MAQAKQPGRDKSLASLHKATDTLSTMLAQEVKELNARQKAQRADGSDPALMKGLKEATAVLKDLAAVAKDPETIRVRMPRPGRAAWCFCQPWRTYECRDRMAAPAPAGGVHAPPGTRSPVRGRGRRRQE